MPSSGSKALQLLRPMPIWKSCASVAPGWKWNWQQLLHHSFRITILVCSICRSPVELWHVNKKYLTIAQD